MIYDIITTYITCIFDICIYAKGKLIYIYISENTGKFTNQQRRVIPSTSGPSERWQMIFLNKYYRCFFT